MKSLLSLVLAIILAASPAGATTTDQADEASRGWSKVRGLEPGTEIMLTVARGPSGRRRAVLSDDSGLTVLHLEHTGLTPEARRELVDAASDHPEWLSHDRPNLVGRHVRVGPDGVFVAGRRIGDSGQVVERIARVDVQQVMRPARKRGSKWGALIGAGVGGWLGFGTAVGLATKQCGASCRDEERAAWAALIGLPIAGGLIGYHGFARRSAEVIYRARAVP